MYCEYGHGLSCYHCDNCHLNFAIDCLAFVDEPNCPNCGSEDCDPTGERLIGEYKKEWNSVEECEKYKMYYKDE